MLTLKEAREKRGVKQLAVAKAIGVTRQTYAKYEENPRNMTVQAAKKACEFLGFEIGEISFS